MKKLLGLFATALLLVCGVVPNLVSAAPAEGETYSQDSRVLVAGFPIPLVLNKNVTGGGSSSGGPPPPLNAKKWHPGHYTEEQHFTMLPGNIDEGGRDAGAEKANTTAILRAGPASILGQDIIYTWRACYNTGTFDASDATGCGMDNDYKRITGYQSGTVGVGAGPQYLDPRRMGIYILTTDFFRSTPDRVVPQYILNAPATYGAGASGGEGGWWTTTGSCGCACGSVAAHWRSSISSEFQNFLGNMVNHVFPDGYTMDTSPYIEWIKPYLETASTSPQTVSGGNCVPGDPSFTYGNMITELKAINTKLANVAPHVNIVSTDNFLTTNPQDTLDFHATWQALGIGESGPDTLGTSPGSTCGPTYYMPWGQCAYIGLKWNGSGSPYTTAWVAGGVDQRGVVPLLATIQGSETTSFPGAIGPFTISDILTNLTTNLKATHAAWTMLDPGQNPSGASWLGTATTIGQWNSAPGTFGGVLDHIYQDTGLVTTCPSAYNQGCNTH